MAEHGMVKYRCRRCGTILKRENDETLKKEYPLYCPVCDENMYYYEAEDMYRIFTECTPKVAGFRKQLRAGHKIRVDLFNGTPLWKVPELLKCKNWKVDSKCNKGVCLTYYIDVLEV